jgi:hypothetical protein
MEKSIFERCEKVQSKFKTQIFITQKLPYKNSIIPAKLTSKGQKTKPRAKLLNFTPK